MEAVDEVQELVRDALAFGGFQFGPRTKAQDVVHRAYQIVALYGCPPDEAVLRALSGEQVIPTDAVH